jgi:hypothetical protein
MSNPFLNVHIQPSYAKNQAVISWTTSPGYIGAEYYVFKSYNKGIAPWKLVNEEPVYANLLQDKNLFVDGDPYYRVLMVWQGQEFDSPVVGTFDKLSKAQYGGVSRMMQLEYLRMSTGNGIQVLHYIPLIDGEYVDTVDPETQQMYGLACRDDDTENLGEMFKGGFASPVYTWIEIARFGDDDRAEDDSGLGVNNKLIHAGRLLAFPRPKPNHLIVHPPTDNRYVVTSKVTGNFFRGVFPISYDVSLQLLRKTDPRYKIKVPSPLPTPLWAKYE